MIDFTPFFRSHFLGRLQQHARYIDHADAVQQGELVRLIEKASLTRIAANMISQPSGPTASLPRPCHYIPMRT